MFFQPRETYDDGVGLAEVCDVRPERLSVTANDHLQTG